MPASLRELPTILRHFHDTTVPDLTSLETKRTNMTSFNHLNSNHAAKPDPYAPSPCVFPEISARCQKEIDQLLEQSREHYSLLEKTFNKLPEALKSHGMNPQDIGIHTVEDRLQYREYDATGLHWIPRRNLRPDDYRTIATTDTSWSRQFILRTCSGKESTLRSFNSAICSTEILCVWIAAADFEIKRCWRPDNFIGLRPPEGPDFHEEIRMIGAAARYVIRNNLNTWRHHSASRALPFADRQDELIPEVTPAAWIAERIVQTAASYQLVKLSSG